MAFDLCGVMERRRPAWPARYERGRLVAPVPPRLAAKGSSGTRTRPLSDGSSPNENKIPVCLTACQLRAV